MRISKMQSTVAETKKGNPYLKYDSGKNLGLLVGIGTAICANNRINRYMRSTSYAVSNKLLPSKFPLPKLNEYIKNPLKSIANLRGVLSINNAPKLTQAAVHLGSMAAVFGACVGACYLVGAAMDKLSNKHRAHQADKLAEKMQAEKMNENEE